jgi:serine/threonine protein kinase
LAGRHLGQYRLLKQLGSGGFGAVYSAMHERLGHPRAVKVLWPHLAADRGFIRRFEREAHLAAGLHHPNIVRVFDIDQADGYHYIAMELLEGISLRDFRHAGGPLPLDRSIQIFEQLASALDFAHERRVVHRDLRPANVIVGSDNHATLIDFGLARESERLTQRLTQTPTDTVLGTADYMAPEAITGASKGPSIDLYALGMMAYELLAGRLPFQGNNLQTLYLRVMEAPPPPDRFQPSLPAQMGAVLLRQLSINPHHRYPSAVAFVAALKAAAPSPPPSGVTDVGGASKLEGASVLWVDDYPSNLVHEIRTLAAMGIRIHLSTSTEDALANLRYGPQKFDVVISDLGRGADTTAGLTLLREKARLADATPCILYATPRLFEYRQEALELGAFGLAVLSTDLYQLVLQAITGR